MKNTCLLFLSLALFLSLLYTESNAQTSASVKKSIEQANKQFITWFNAGKADSIITQYHPEACLVDRGCGKEFIKNYYQTESGKYKMKDITTLNVTVNNNTATETGAWKLQLASGHELTGKYSSEWKLVNKQWLIFKETILE